jgi:hypothetical protein
MTASNGPAEVEMRTAHCDRFRHAGSGRRQGRRRDRKLELHGIPLCLGWVHEDERRAQDSASRRWQEHLPPDLSFRYLADALGFSEPPRVLGLALAGFAVRELYGRDGLALLNFQPALNFFKS